MQAMMLRMAMVSAMAAMEKGERFLSDLQQSQLVLGMLRPLKAELAHAFLGGWFDECGYSCSFSDYEPSRILADVANEKNIEVGILDVPPKYYVSLKVDHSQCLGKGELVFNLIEKSDGVEFNREVFTISQLGEEFQSQMDNFRDSL